MGKKIRRIEWQRGDSSIVIMLGLCLLLAIIAFAITNNYTVFHHSEKNQMLADIVSDGAVTLANNGWGLETKKITQAKNELLKLNEEWMGADKLTVKTRKVYVPENSSKASGGTDAQKNTVTATATLRYTGLSTSDLPSRQVSLKNSSSTRMIFYGGMAIVKYAYSFTYQANPVSFTHYVYGAGRGGGEDWQQYSDCSSFVAGVFRHFGYDLPAYTGSMQSMGVEVTGGLDQARPGDILLYFHPGDPVSYHVGIYAGKTSAGVHMQVHNSNPVRNCIFSPISSTNVMVRRIIKSSGKQYAKPADNAYLGAMTEYEARVYMALKESGMPNGGIMAIMGNWATESLGCLPYALNSHFDRNYTDYADKLNNGTYNKEIFTRYKYSPDGIGDGGYGLAQWTQSRPGDQRKGNLYNYIVAHGGDSKVKFSDAALQVGFALEEMRTSYPAVYARCMASSNNPSVQEVQDLTEYVHIWYEAGGDTSDKYHSLAGRKAHALQIYAKLMASRI